MDAWRTLPRSSCSNGGARWESTSEARSWTPCWYRTAVGCAEGRRRRQQESVSRRRRQEAARSAFTHGRRSRTKPCSSAAAREPPSSRTGPRRLYLRARPARTSAACAEHPSAGRPVRALLRRPGPYRPRRRARPARPRHAARDRGGRDRRLAPLLVSRQRAGAGRGGGAPSAPPGRPRRGLARDRPRVPGVRARVHDGDRRVPRSGAEPLSGRACRGLLGGSPSGTAGHALVGRAGDPRRGGRACRVRAPLRPGGRRRRCGADRGARWLRGRPLVRHGRDVDGCLRDRERRGAQGVRASGGRPARAAADARSSHGRSRRRIDRAARQGRRAARRARERWCRPGACLLRTRRETPDRDRRELSSAGFPRRSRATSRWTSTRRSVPSPESIPPAWSTS